MGNPVTDVLRIFQHNRPGGRVDRHQAANRAADYRKAIDRRLQANAERRERAAEMGADREKRRRGRAASLLATEAEGSPTTGAKLLGQ